MQTVINAPSSSGTAESTPWWEDRPVCWDCYWWARWRRIAVSVNIRLGHFQNLTESPHVSSLKTLAGFSIRRNTLPSSFLSSRSLSSCVCYYRPAAPWRSAGCGAPTAEPCGASCHDWAFAIWLRSHPTRSCALSTDGVLSKPPETSAEASACLSPDAEATGRPAELVITCCEQPLVDAGWLKLQGVERASVLKRYAATGFDWEWGQVCKYNVSQPWRRKGHSA